MPRLILVGFFLFILTQSVLGVTDPRPDVLGVYFDDFGDQTCKDDLLPFVSFSVWIVYTNPTHGMIRGFEAGYYWTGPYVELGIHWPCGIIWIVPPELDNLSVACTEPFPATVATPLVRFDYMFMGSGPPDGTFHVEMASGSPIPVINPYIILADGNRVEALQGQVAHITTDCSVASETMGWGTIKSLYR
ncbi:MAG: hypothetical protein ABFS42_03055 [Candidatus Krumholzibacteriota bacterium]